MHTTDPLRRKSQLSLAAEQRDLMGLRFAFISTIVFQVGFKIKKKKKFFEVEADECIVYRSVKFYIRLLGFR
jgi:hypothetical protein